MSYSEGTYVRPRYPVVYFDDIHAKSPSGVEEEKRQCQRSVYEIREKLAMLIASNPKDLMTESELEEYGSATSWITEQLNDIEEDLQYALAKYGRLEVLEQILYEWEDSMFVSKSYESFYDDIDFTSKDYEIVFPEEEFVDTKEKMEISFGAKLPKEKSIEEVFANGMKNLELDNRYREKFSTLIYAIVDGKLFTTYTGQWLFKDKKNAIEAINHRLNISMSPYINQKYMKECPEFFESLKPYVKDDEIERFNDYATNPDKLGSIVSESFKEFYNITIDAYNRFLFSKIQFKQISEIIN